MSLTKVTYSMIDGAVVNVFDFGAVGDGVADDTVALQNAMNQVGKTVFLPKGTYKTTATLTPRCAQIIGESALDSIIEPSSAVTKVMSIHYGGVNDPYPTYMQGFKVDGANTTNATGLYFGDVDSCAVTVDTIYVQNFTGTSGVGIRIGQVLKSNFRRVFATGCYNGMLCLDPTGISFPTTVHFDSCVFSDNVNVGAELTTGWGIAFTSCVFESNLKHGSFLLPGSGGKLKNIVYQSCWFEQNGSTSPNLGSLVAGNYTALGGAQIELIVRDCFFNLDVNYNKAVIFAGSAVGGVLSNPRFDYVAANSIEVRSDAFVTLTDWLPTGSADYETVVFASDGKVRTTNDIAYVRNGLVSCPTATATTIFTVPTGEDFTANVRVWLSGSSSVGTVTVSQSGSVGAAPVLLGSAVSGLTFSVSGQNIQVTQSSGSTANCNWLYDKTYNF
jgi:hypothetical protein